MPTAPPRPCQSPGCPALVPRGVGRGYCPTHARHQEQARPYADTRKLYHTSRWRAIRRHQLAAQPLCAHCLPQRVTPATDVDHVTPHRGDTEAFWGGALQSLCRACHSRKTQRGE